MFPGLASAETLYAKKSGTKVKAQPSGRAEVVQTLFKGTPVQVMETSGKFYKVRLPNKKSGWVFKFRLTAKQPSAPTSDSQLQEAIGGDQKFAVLESTSGASIRGLSPTSQKFARQRGFAPETIAAVTQMESYRVTEKELDLFQSQGKLGEYSE